MPLGVIEAALRLACLLIEGTPMEQRRATALAWWALWWPLGKLILARQPEVIKQIDAIMGAGEDKPK